MAEFDRREFLKLTGLSTGAVAAAGCGDPVSKLIPYVVQPEEITPGIAVTYASTCRECPAACGLHVRTREGRPVKLEGNPNHPVNRGALCSRGQAAIGRTYHPDRPRYAGPRKRVADGWEPITWDEGIALLAEKVREAGSGTYVLGGDPGPTASALIDNWVSAVGAGGRVVYEPFAAESLRSATKAVFGEPGVPVFDLSAADLVIDFGSDVLETGNSPTEHARQLADARNIDKHKQGGAHFVYVGPRLSMTASNADEWLPAKPGSEGLLALAIARVAAAHGAGSADDRAALKSLLDSADVEQAASASGIDKNTIERLGRAVARAKSVAALPPGPGLTSRRATATAGAVLVLNYLGGAAGRTLRIAPVSSAATANYHDALTLIEAMKNGKVRVLLVHDANPVHSLAPDTGFAKHLESVFTVSFASIPDETSERADLILPDHTPLESWGDAEPRKGIRSILQPTIRPLYDTRALGDTLLDAGRAVGASGLPSGSFRSVLEAAWSGGDWREDLALGGRFEGNTADSIALASSAARLEVAEPLIEGDGAYTLLAYPSPYFYDGRGANLSILQELPDPATKIAYQSWAEVSLTTAAKLGVEDPGQVIALETGAGQRLEVPVWPRGGIRDDVIAVPIGQGHDVGYFASAGDSGDSGKVRGVNAISLLPGAATDENGGRAWLTVKVKASATGDFRALPIGQTNDNKRGRQLGEAVSLSALGGAASTGHASAGQPHVSAGGHGDEHGASGGGHGEVHEIRQPYDPADQADEGQPYRWGMSVDLDRCTGCSACVAACYVENNIPVVGENNFRSSRTMSWIRIERYIGDGERDLRFGRGHIESRERLGNVDVRHSPMMCQQCGAAPCEPVCPVIATYHNDEGLNAMVYNRCIGTRYCSNNCPYKVRRFNWYDYQTPTSRSFKAWPEPMRLGLNPDVTVRGQGVMEKCTFCVQRIQDARQGAKDEGRPIRDGEARTACQQSCPTRAIEFGNLRDPQSAVAKSHAANHGEHGEPGPRAYHALHVLNTRPAVTYLSKVKRGATEA